ncbi:RNA polymerase, sigma subunit, ECF family [Salipiger thiooxidans]|uniref:RNA polymerase, sigma subunit, ECF family n=1 Tax=Salipiger thiooxidans TaxID=282683 RepID=A0A1G7BDS2_9RHOB|nr:RNA polymerase sigma factor [Salipiger thiooxidans]SDE25117.1 RNA polymerase, sigma subunit, ECF family [Salipiger thiooxidans]
MPYDAMSDCSDETLLAAYAAGDPAAARALTMRLGPRAFGHAMRMLNDRAEAEDIVQEALLRLWRAAPGWREGEAKVSTWVYRVVSNLCIDRIRRRRGGHVDIDAVAEPPDPSPSAEQGLQDTARGQALQAALDTLPDRQKQAVVLRHLEGLSNPEIAGIMDIGVRAVESLSARGRKALQGLLAPRRAELGYDDD